MTTNERYPAKYPLRIEAAQAERVAAFRETHGMPSEAAALRKLLDLGLAAAAAQTERKAA